MEEVFNRCGGLEKLLEGRTRAFIKINAIDCRPEAYTSPAVLEATIQVLQQNGVKEIRVIENCTQGNFTRLVFSATELGAVCRRHGARPLYLDEEPVVRYQLPGLDREARFPRILRDEILPEKRSVFFLNLPKLKTHSMSVVTLGIKNLLGLMDQRDRLNDHNFNLHRRLAALGELFSPDFTLIDGINAVFHGHYPPVSVVERCLAPLKILIGGRDMLAVDIVAARILGYSIEEVEHLRLAVERKVGCGSLEEIDLAGDLTPFTRKYPYQLLPDMPPDVRIVRGTERCCPEGCRNNTEAVLQFLYLDHAGRGGFTILMGKGFTPAVLESIEGPLLLAGCCAVEETKHHFMPRVDKRHLFQSPACNDLASTVKALTRLMKVNPLRLVPLNPLHSLALLLVSRLKGSKARVAL